MSPAPKTSEIIDGPMGLMSEDFEPKRATYIWTAVIHPSCICEWRPEASADDGTDWPHGNGWWMTERKPNCILHGWKLERWVTPAD
jgi:hypothetical protein